MAFSSCLCNPQVSFKIDYPGRPLASCRRSVGRDEKLCVSIKSSSTNLFGQRVATAPDSKQCNWSFLGGSRLIVRIKVARFFMSQKSSPVYASWITSSQLASSAFTLGTAAVLPFYFLMVLAPKSQLNMIYKLGGLPNLDFPSTLPLVKTYISLNFQALTIKSMESSIPYVVLGLLYAYLLYLSWTPDTLRMIFASKYWLPELPGIAKMFSSEMTLSSAWIHLLAVDLFAARQVFHDGLENEVETRHSVSLCLFFCPIGIVTHFITKALTKKA